MNKFLTGIKKVISGIVHNQDSEKHNVIKDENKEDYLNEFIEEIDSLYNNFHERIKKENWELLIEKVSNKLELDTISKELLNFFMKHDHLPFEIWHILDGKFHWSEKSEELTNSFPNEYIQYVMANINNEYKLRYYLLKECIDGSYDEFIDLYYEAYFAFNNKNLYIANKRISEAKKICPTHLDLVTLEGNYYAEINRVEEAIEKLSYVINEDGEDSNAYYDRANVFLRSGKLQNAYEDYKKCLDLNPDNIGAQYEMAGCMLNIGYYEEAAEFYKNLLRMYPNHKEVTLNLNSATSFLIDELEEELWAGNCKDEDKYILAKSYYHFDEYQKCFDIISNIENSIETNAEFYLLCGDCLNKLNEGEKAEKYYDKAIQLEPNNYDIYYGKGELFYGLKQYDKALKCFNKVIELEPDFVKVYLIKAMCLKNLSEYEQAIEECNKYLDMDSEDGHALYLKGQCLMKLGKYENAIRYYDKAVEAIDGNQEMCYMKATTLYLLGNYKDATQYYEWCLEYGDDGSESYKEIYTQAAYNMGLTVLKLGNTEDAYEYLNKAIEVNNNYLPAYAGRVLLSVQAKNYSKCIEICAQGLNIQKENINDYSKEDIINEFKKKLESYYSYLDIKSGYEEIIKALEEIV